MSRVVLAPDKFKGSLSAVDVAAALERGIRSLVGEDVDIVTRPVADGGDGTVDAVVAAGFERIAVHVTGPGGRLRATSYARRGDLAVVELADACGLVAHGRDLDPMGASSRGLGEIIRATMDAGCRRLVVGIGGSASTDGGAGMAAALGAVALDSEGRVVPDGGGSLDKVATLDRRRLDERLPSLDLAFACDVDNPLTGRRGAAFVYGPQKGASPEQVIRLDASLSHWADVVAQKSWYDHRDVPGAGAAGGVGYAGIALLGARLQSGIATLLGLVEFDEAAQGADLVVTGEGKLDAQTAHGKAPAGVAEAATAAGARVVAVCGRDELDSGSHAALGFSHVYALDDLEPDPVRSMAEAAPLLEQVGRSIAAEHLTNQEVSP